MAIAYMEHTPIGKATQKEPETAAAHAVYIMSLARLQGIVRQYVPVEYDKFLGWINSFEAKLRKNGRVVDKIMIAMHRELKLDQAKELIRRFKWRISEGRTPFFAALQGFDTDNPHAHVMFFDRDVKTGKRVFQTSEQGSTDRLKAIWQAESNAYFQELGIDARIQFGPKVEEEVCNQALVANDEPPTLPADAVEEPEAVTGSHELPEPLQEPEPPAYVEEEPEEPGVAVITREGPLFTQARIRDALDAANERTMVLTAIERRDAAWQAYRDAEDTLNTALGALAARTAAQAAAANATQAAQWRVDATHPNGKPQGFKLSLFGFSWRSPGYKRAEAAQAEHAARYDDYQRASVDAYNASQDLEAAGQEWQARKETALKLTDHVKVYGNDDEVLAALDTMQATIRQHVEVLNFGEVKALFDEGKLSRDEYLQAVELMGEAELEADRGQDNGQSY